MEPTTPRKDEDRQQKMARALGAAFLSHQVAELEKSVSTLQIHGRGRGGGGGGRGGGRGRGRGDSNGGESGMTARRSSESTKVTDQPQVADRIVVDASVLINCLSTVKAWCREGRKEVLMVPLEALNTLDLLKKGPSSVAIRARAASRLLEAQVGNNVRIFVQRDDEYVPWADVQPPFFKARNGLPSSSPRSSSEIEEGNESSDSPAGEDIGRNAVPSEWMKRTLCCAKWEVNANPGARVVLAIVAPDTLTTSTPSKSSHTFNRHESRVSGSITRFWAKKLGLDVLEVGADAPTDATPATADSHTSAFPHRGGRGGTARSPRGGSDRTNRGGFGNGPTDSYNGKWRRPSNDYEPRRPNLVEKVPSGVPAGKVIRVLARGEKLEP